MKSDKNNETKKTSEEESSVKKGGCGCGSK